MTIESLLTAGSENTDAAPMTTADTTTEAAATTAATTEGSANPATAQTDAEADDAPDTTKVADGAPETYTDFKAPEGQELAADVATEVKTLAKELNLPQDKAQKVFDTAAKLAAKGVEAQVAHIQSINDDWRAQVKADPEIGGDKLDANLAKAKAAMAATSTPQLQVLLDKSGLGNHPEVIRHFLKIAPAFAEDKHVNGGKAPNGDSKSTEKVLYPKNA